MNYRWLHTLDSLALPPMHSSGSCVTACDFDRDGDLDLFVGGRVSPADYPKTPRSYLLRNSGHSSPGKPQFEDVTNQIAPELAHIGMVTAAFWTDSDSDGWPDLLLAGEWMPITLVKNTNGQRLAKATDSFIRYLNGLVE